MPDFYKFNLSSFTGVLEWLIAMGYTFYLASFVRSFPLDFCFGFTIIDLIFATQASDLRMAKGMHKHQLDADRLAAQGYGPRASESTNGTTAPMMRQV
jgi:hypothetical protein